MGRFTSSTVLPKPTDAGSIIMKKQIYIREFVGRWYIVWSDTGQTIASFASEFEAYAARRAIMNSKEFTV